MKNSILSRIGGSGSLVSNAAFLRPHAVRCSGAQYRGARARGAGFAAIIAVAMACFSFASVLEAQSGEATDPRFQPWMGCWTTTAGGGIQAGAPNKACVVRSSTVAGSVDVLLYASDSLVSRSALPRPGVETGRSLEDCSGVETAAWASGNTKLVLRADFTCAAGLKRTETGLMSMTPEGNWLQLQHVRVGNSEATTSTRFSYDPAATASHGTQSGGTASTATARMAVGAPASPEQVLELSQLVPPALTEVWLAETGVMFHLNGKLLADLSRRGMPGSVIDMMVAVSNPDVFAVRSSEFSGGLMGQPGMQGAAQQGVQQGITSNTVGVQTLSNAPGTVVLRERVYCGAFCYGPGGMGAWGFGWQYGYGPWDPWMRYDPYMAGYGYPYGISPYSYPGAGVYPYRYGGGVFYGGPVIVVNGKSSNGYQMPGQAVNGRGYAPRSSGGSAAGSRRGSNTTGNTTGNTNARNPAAGATTGTSGASGGTTTTGRTAKPRTPPPPAT